MRVGVGGKAAVAAASALLAFPLAGAPLYASSATSEALQVSVAGACPSDTGIVLTVDADWVADLEARASDIAHVGAPIDTLIADIDLLESSSGAEPGRLVWRDGASTQIGATVIEPPAGAVLVPAAHANDAVVRTGDSLRVAPSGRAKAEQLEVAGVYPDIPLQPEPSFWCGLSDVLRPGVNGEPAPPVFLTGSATFDGDLAAAAQRLWEVHPDAEHLTAARAREVVDELRAISAEVAVRRGAGVDATQPAPAIVADQPSPGLAVLIDDAEDVGGIVERSLLPIRLGLAALALGFLVLAALAVARDRRVELRLRLIRGEGPRGIALRIAESHVLPALAGTVVGFATAVAGVRLLGPSPELEAGAIRSAAITAVIGLLVAVAVVSVVGARAANASVDRRGRAARRLTPPWELFAVVPAVVAYLRIDHAAGLRLVGTPAGPGDALAQSFPLLALVALAALLVRPLRWVFGRARRNGRQLSASGLRGWRRLGADPGRYAFIAAAVALGVGTAVAASSLAATSDQMLQDKATTFLGADLRVVTDDGPTIPPGLTGTIVSRVDVASAGAAVQVLGIDPATFAEVVRWRADASDYPLADLLAVLEVDDMLGAALPAIVVGGPLPTQVLVGADDVSIDIDPVATADFFPGKTAVPLVIVNRNALAADEVPAASEIWLRDPPPDATQQLADAGVRVRGSQRSADVFDPGSSLAVRWSFEVLWAVVASMAAALLFGQLLVLAARRREARAAWDLHRRMGANRSEELVATIAAFATPVAIGAGLGTLAGWVVVRVTAEHLDTLDNLVPPLRTVVDLVPAGAAAIVALVCVVIGGIVARTLVAGTGTEVMRDDLEP